MNNDPQHFQTLMQQIRAGSQDAASELAKEYGSHLRRAIRQRMLSELRPKFDSIDFEQQVWKSFFAEAKSLPNLKNPHQLISYLGTMAVRKVIDEGRHLQTLKHNVQREVRLDEASAVAGPHPVSRDPTPSAVAVFNEEWELLVMDEPPLVRRILELRLAGMTFFEIAKEVQLHNRTVRRVVCALVKRKNRRRAEQDADE